MATIQASGSIEVPFPKRHKVCIATPAYKSLYTGAYVESLFCLVDELRKQGIGLVFSHIDFADIVDARNYLISRFYFDHPSCSHLLFLDNDMGYDAKLILSMLELDTEVAGVIYPKRNINLEKLHAAGGKSFAEAYAKACEFIGPTLPEKPGAFIKVKRIGAGILLIKRSAIATMIKMCPEISPTEKAKGKTFRHLSGFITPFKKVEESGIELSEDFSFCHRWTEQCGGTILASTSSPIKHVGEITIETKLSDSWPKD